MMVVESHAQTAIFQEVAVAPLVAVPRGFIAARWGIGVEIEAERHATPACVGCKDHREVRLEVHFNLSHVRFACGVYITQ